MVIDIIPHKINIEYTIYSEKLCHYDIDGIMPQITNSLKKSHKKSKSLKHQLNKNHK